METVAPLADDVYLWPGHHSYQQLEPLQGYLPPPFAPPGHVCTLCICHHATGTMRLLCPSLAGLLETG